MLPARKRVPSLQELCLSNLSSNIDISCDENKNPFANLPNNIMDDVANRAKYANKIHPNHLQTVIRQYSNRLEMAIHRYTTRLNFHVKPQYLIQRGISLICKVCENLIHLNISKSNAKVDNIKELAKSIPNIKYLYLRSTSTTDDVLLILGNNCPKLRELDISSCNITDIGIKALCTQDNRRSIGGKCRLISKLYVMDTLITDEGALTAIINLQYLQEFNHLTMFNVFGTIYNHWTPDIQLNLKKIYQVVGWNAIMTNIAIDATASLCPNITEMVLMDLKETDTGSNWLIKLAKFPQLTNLSLDGSVLNDPVKFDVSITPLLKAMGNQLKILRLDGIRMVNLWDIGIYCRQLNRLFLSMNDNYAPSSPSAANIPCQTFVNLRAFDIYCDEDKDIPIDQFEIVLSNCHQLYRVCFYQCQSLSDDLLARVRDRNSFSKLCYFSILRCHNIQMSSIMWLVKTCPSLKILRYRNCAKICLNDHQELQRFVQTENLDLSIPKNYKK